MACDTKICFVLIYNHNYESNISKLERIYKNKFTHIFHLMPFYSGKKENVIPVYQNSYFFCDFVRQGLPRFYDETFTHYVFCADDLILNPQINENNIISALCKNNNEAGFISNYNPLSMGSIYNWSWTISILSAFYNKICYLYQIFLNNLGCQFQNFLPPYEEACKKIEKHGLSSKNIPIGLIEQIFKAPYDSTTALATIVNNYHDTPEDKFTYPLVQGYSDFFIIPAKKIKDISRLFGIFSSGGVFVEAATPTSMLLCLDKVFSINDTEFYTNTLWEKSERDLLLQNYNSDFNKLYESFPEDLLFIHPVKLSQWKMKD